MTEVAAGPAGSPAWPAEPPPPSERLHQPWRAFVALFELGLAGLSFWFATLCWSNVVVPVVLRLGDGTELTSTRYEGDWVAGAIALGALACLLVVDAVRQLLLAVRARRRPSKKHRKDATTG
ncbi:hypothetical protein [Amycolatopsis palatopharyngis]|uniref:hypothetical protein n=1 Tax=Amycolatopsis palatopharyngis TaxID=187982 RepID=UPI000E244E15|nr:hypothetical protein [Amycolatopsis palatopharyngis]